MEPTSVRLLSGAIRVGFRLSMRRMNAYDGAQFPIRVKGALDRMMIDVHALMRRLLLVSMLLVLPGAWKAQAQSNPVAVDVFDRQRVNAFQWFAATPHAEQYGYVDSLLRVAVRQQVGHVDWLLEMGQAAELFLPTDAVSPVSAQGQLGLGGTYYTTNENEFPAAVSLRGGFVRYRWNESKNSVRLGRFEFFGGEETTPKDQTLLWLQHNRMAQRLVGNFGFTDGQRSFDGADMRLNGSSWNVTAMAARAVGGVFNMNANPEINVDLQSLAYTRSVAQGHVLLRGFAIGYHDGRTGLVKTDNRPVAARDLDHHNIRIGSYGADAIAAIPAGKSTVDLLFWGVLQNGQWGVQKQRSGAFDLEAGWKLDNVPSTPWLRGGVLRTTGDRNSNDDVHGTFFQLLPTPRVYARFPYFNMMNLTQQFVQVIDRPAKRLELRSDLNFLQLTSSSDLWYQGGGAFDNKVFGYTGRPANGHASFSSLWDVSADYGVTRRLSLEAYYGKSFGKSVVAAIYPRVTDAQYGFLELDYRFSHTFGRAAR